MRVYLYDKNKEEIADEIVKLDNPCKVLQTTYKLIKQFNAYKAYILSNSTKFLPGFEGEIYITNDDDCVLRIAYIYDGDLHLDDESINPVDLQSLMTRIIINALVTGANLIEFSGAFLDERNKIRYIEGYILFDYPPDRKFVSNIDCDDEHNEINFGSYTAFGKCFNDLDDLYDFIETVAYFDPSITEVDFRCKVDNSMYVKGTYHCENKKA